MLSLKCLADEVAEDDNIWISDSDNGYSNGDQLYYPEESGEVVEDFLEDVPEDQQDDQQVEQQEDQSVDHQIDQQPDGEVVEDFLEDASEDQQDDQQDDQQVEQQEDQSVDHQIDEQADGNVTADSELGNSVSNSQYDSGDVIWEENPGTSSDAVPTVEDYLNQLVIMIPFCFGIISGILLLRGFLFNG